MTAVPFDELARILSERMLNGTAAGLVVALFAWILLRVTGKQNSSTRFAVWFAALAAISMLPFVSRLAPSVLSTAKENVGGSAIALPSYWAEWLFRIWVIVAAMGLVRLVIGLLRLRQLRATANIVDAAALDPTLRKTLEDFRSCRKVTVCASDRQKVPAAIGFFKPMIVLPTWARSELSTAELNSILIHELAHLRRWDDWTNLVQKIFRALLFFHPAVWWVEGQISLEREMACDDVVLSRTANARAYAECLVSMAEKSFLHRSLALTQAAVSRMRQTSQRVAQILDGNRRGATRIWKPALGLVATFAVICGVLQSRTPQLVAFRQSEPSAAKVESTTSQPGLRAVALKSVPMLSASAPNRKTSVSKPVLAQKLAPAATGTIATEARFNGPFDAAMTPAATIAWDSHPVPAQTMLVVFRSQQFNSGQVQWTVWVWQVNVQQPVEIRVPPKRT
jgi:beta-lactamase regulating signal transducer with metallopeptidase domain